MKRTTIFVTLMMLGSLLGISSAKSITFSYCDEMDGDIGWNQALKARVLMEIPQETAQLYNGADITGISIGYGHSGDTNANIVILKNIDDATPLYTQAATLTNSEWTDIAITTPYNIDGSAFYIGYEIDITNANHYPVAVDGVSDANPCGGWVATYDESTGKWMAENLVTYGFGNGCIRITLTGDMLPDYDMEMKKLNIPSYVKLDEPFTIRGEVKNMGKDITSYEVAYSVDGGEAIATTINQNVASGEKVAFEITAAAPLAFGTYEYTVTVTKIEGQDDENNGNNTLSSTVNVMENLGTRKVLLENFSTQNCSQCPAAHELVSAAVKDRDDVIWVAHHAGFGTDEFTITASEIYLAFYNNQTYAPGFMLDRRNLINQGAAASSNCPVFGAGGTTTYFSNLIDYCAEQPAFVDLEITNQYNAETRELTTTITGEKYTDLPETTRLSVFLIEDGLTGIQATNSGYDNEYTHNHVLRAVLNKSWGKEIEFNSNTFEMAYTKELDEEWNAENMTVVAFVYNYNAADINDRAVHNANSKMVLDSSASVDRITNEDINVWGTYGCINITGEYDQAEVYGLDGRLVEQARGTQTINVAAGIYIVRVDGYTTKVIVR